ncbi:MAG: hypothetical protein JWP81_2185, partial [Ferruginibacter sp.]|nr:hypothetical protein [Ferruginibacter sp.]
AAGRVRQADCHHLYNYETSVIHLVSRDTLQPQTKADSELKPKFQCPALTFGNALLAAGIYV